MTLFEFGMFLQKTAHLSQSSSMKLRGAIIRSLKKKRSQEKKL